LCSIRNHACIHQNVNIINIETIPLISDYEITDQEICHDFLTKWGFNYTINNKENEFNGWGIYSVVGECYLSIILYNKQRWILKICALSFLFFCIAKVLCDIFLLNL